MKDLAASSTGGAYTFLQANLPLVLWTYAEKMKSSETVPIVIQKWEKSIITTDGETQNFMGLLSLLDLRSKSLNILY